jgi:hypothetical protein
MEFVLVPLYVALLGIEHFQFSLVKKKEKKMNPMNVYVLDLKNSKRIEIDRHMRHEEKRR